MADCFTKIPVPVNKSIPESEIENGSFYMLIDQQENLITKQAFSHFAYKLTTQSGVQNNSEIHIEYNPAYQKVSLHAINVYRNGEWTDYSGRVSIKELQREQGLAEHIYDETITIYIILEDIRAGDIVEYSYTTTGTNPVFDNLIYKLYSYQATYTILEYYLKIIKPEALKLTLKTYHSDLKPNISKTKYGEEWVWEKNNVPKIKIDKLIPVWYTPYSLIEISSAESWNQVKKWGVKTFTVAEKLSEPIKKVCKDISENNSDPSAKTLAALRYVQKNIRYLGIEIGENSQKPHTPNQVFQQGFGDCKDKSLLLTKMLNEMGIKAYPALVSTTRHIWEGLPSPLAFNHCVVVTEVRDGTYWLDPTITNQGGDLNTSYFKPYKLALILDDNMSGLDEVKTASKSKIEVLEKFQVQVPDSSTTLVSYTSYFGYDADLLRYMLANQSKSILHENSFNFYKNIYPKIDTLGGITILDDTVKNIVRIYEKYSIKDFWKQDETQSRKGKKAEVVSHIINDKISMYQASQGSRTSPLYLEYPMVVDHTIQLDMPFNPELFAEEKRVENLYFTFKLSTLQKGNTVILNYYYKTRQDFIPAGTTPVFLEDIEKVKNMMSYTFTDRFLSAGILDGINLYVLNFFIVYLFIAFYALYRINKNYTNKLQENPFGPEPEAIGGWVIIPILSLIASPFYILFTLFRNNFFSSSTWALIGENNNLSGYAVLSVSILLRGLYIVIPVALIILASRYDRRFPKFMIYFILLDLVINIIDYMLGSAFPDVINIEGYGNIARSVIYGLIWIPFFLNSARCRKIFTQ